MGTPTVEIIDFTRPDGSRKNLFVTNIPGTLQDEDIVYRLTEKFRPYGLLYGIQVFPTQWKNRLATTESENTKSETTPMCIGFYAFVTFYSAADATRAKKDVNGVIILGDEECKVTFAKRKKEVLCRQQLYFSKCYELVNHYLGFNSWSTHIKTLFEDRDERETTSAGSSTTVTTGTSTESSSPGQGYVKYVCLIELTVQDLHTDGVGVWKETVATKDPLCKIQATAKCKKLCHMRAIENAFSKVLLVVLGNGKVTVEIDTTRPEFRTDMVPDEQLIKVNDLDDQPETEADLVVVETNLTIRGDKPGADVTDDITVNILQELENEMSL